MVVSNNSGVIVYSVCVSVRLIPEILHSLVTVIVYCAVSSILLSDVVTRLLFLGAVSIVHCRPLTLNHICNLIQCKTV